MEIKSKQTLHNLSLWFFVNIRWSYYGMYELSIYIPKFSFFVFNDQRHKKRWKWKKYNGRCKVNLFDSFQALEKSILICQIEFLWIEIEWWTHLYIVCRLGIQIRNMKVVFNFYCTWRWVTFEKLMMKIYDFLFYSAKSFSHPV